MDIHPPKNTLLMADSKLIRDKAKGTNKKRRRDATEESKRAAVSEDAEEAPAILVDPSSLQWKQRVLGKVFKFHQSLAEEETETETDTYEDTAVDFGRLLYDGYKHMHHIQLFLKRCLQTSDPALKKDAVAINSYCERELGAATYPLPFLVEDVKYQDEDGLEDLVDEDAIPIEKYVPIEKYGKGAELAFPTSWEKPSHLPPTLKTFKKPDQAEEEEH